MVILTVFIWQPGAAFARGVVKSDTWWTFPFDATVSERVFVVHSTICVVWHLIAS